MQRISTIGVLLISLTVLLTGCAGKEGQSPTALVEAFYKAINEGNLEEAAKLCHPFVGMTIINNPLSKGEFLTQKGKIAKVIIHGEKIEGDEADVEVELTYNDGKTAKVSQRLYNNKEKGTWQIGRAPNRVGEGFMGKVPLP